MSDSILTQFWGQQLDGLLTEIVRTASICEVKLLNPGVVDAVLHDNASVCGHDNPAAFKKLREVLMMTLIVRGRAFDSLGPLEAEALIEEISAKLRERLGSSAQGRFGGTEA
jgi:hypothetical protein